jgi:ABC transport system ATP-binding/permease protein
MSERILKALMQLFALIAGPRSSNRSGRHIVESFLYQQLNDSLVDEYIKLFDGYYALYQKKQSEEDRRAKNLALSSVKVLKICTQINGELDVRQKVIVLVRLIEFIKADSEISDQELEFVQTVSDIFHISPTEFDLLKQFTLNNIESMPVSPNFMLIDGNKASTKPDIRHFYQETLEDQVWALLFEPADMYLIRQFGEHELYLNGQLIVSERVYGLNQGSALRDSKMKPIYYSDIVSSFFFNEFENKIQFAAKNVEYYFKSGVKGLNRIDFVEESGSLIGIMGASGAGKSTLLNVLNGSSKPSAGTVTINGIDIYSEKEKIEGLIGFVSQDDLLIEELTVYQNLYYNAKLCFGDLNEYQINRRVLKVLQSLGLFEIKDMVVGNPLNKKISGGQRKRLNIALELIREPAILFLDEPTSGLSSRDSENIMDLLKELTLKGKLVFTVIHQPSSDIFKMFDKLYILDKGGYLIYDGNPIDSIIYFKSRVHHANWNDSECRICGNVNPEQVFNIIESQMLDEYGNLTKTRKKTPTDWHRHFIESRNSVEPFDVNHNILPKISFRIPGKFKQFLVFVIRDVLSKIANRQYMAINIFEAPLLAFLLSFIIRYFSTQSNTYNLYDNPNLPVYIFMSVIVSIFIGLSVSAEEIIKDQKILKRERFLNLSRSSYLFSKIAILLFISAFQAFLFVLIGNSILGLKGMFLHYWLALFSAWFFSCLLGLNISDSFDTVVTIYILIPFLVIPQLILSGIIVSFDKLNPVISSPDQIPVYGEIITARWAYEALAVHQYMNNDFEKQFYEYNKVLSQSDFKKNYWLKTIENKVSYCERNYLNPTRQLKVKNELKLIRTEIQKENLANRNILFNYLDKLYLESLNTNIFSDLKEYLNVMRSYYLRRYNKASNEKDVFISSMQKTDKEKELFLARKRTYTNENLTSFVRNTNSLDRIIEVKGQLYQKSDPIYLDTQKPFLKAHFYAPYKNIFGVPYPTYWINIIVIWVYSVVMYLTLHFRLLRRTIEYFSNKRKRPGRTGE